MSWDVNLLKFDRGAEATFDLAAARALLGQTSGFRDLDPGVGEIVDDGYAEIYFGAEPSTDIMVAVRIGSASLIELICRLAAELRMAVFFPTAQDFGLAVLDSSLAEELPDRSWEGWENVGEAFDPPTPIVCEDADELATILRSSYDEWEAWAHRSPWP